MKRVSFDITGDIKIPALARPGERVVIDANNIAPIEGILVDAVRMEDRVIRITMVVEDDDAWKLEVEDE